MNQRIDNWTAAYAELYEHKRNLPFQWGDNDCCLFACDFIQALTEIDVATDIRGTYTTALGAVRFMHKFGTIEHLADSFSIAYGFNIVAPALAQRGDVVMTYTMMGKRRLQMLGVWDGNTGLFTGPEGIIRVPLKEIIKAWRI